LRLKNVSSKRGGVGKDDAMQKRRRCRCGNFIGNGTRETREKKTLPEIERNK